MNAPLAKVPFPPAEVSVVSGTSTTEYKIKGSLQAVLEAVSAMFEQYHPYGYGTMVHTILTEDYGGEYVARMSRSNSCD